MDTTHINKTHTPKTLWVKLCLTNLTNLIIFVKHNLMTFVKYKLTMFVKHNLTILVKHWLTIFVNSGVSCKCFSHISPFAVIGIGYSVHMTWPLCV